MTTLLLLIAPLKEVSAGTFGMRGLAEMILAPATFHWPSPVSLHVTITIIEG